MAPVRPQPEVGTVLREWRERRRLSQLDLALEAGVSSRHLSFVETGRSRPGRDMLLRVLGQLKVPFREQNQLLIAAGHAPAYPERSIDDPGLAPVRAALDLILSGHEPYPAVAVDRVWNMVAANSAMLGLAEGMETGDPRLAALLEEVAGYPAPVPEGTSEADPEGMLGPVRMRAPGGGELSFFGMFATFDTPFEVTTSELAVELLFPADQITVEHMTKRKEQAR